MNSLFMNKRTLADSEVERLRWFLDNPILIWRLYRLARPHRLPAVVLAYLDAVAARLEKNPPRNADQVASAFGFPTSSHSASTRAETLLRKLDHYELVQNYIAAQPKKISQDAAIAHVASANGISENKLHRDFYAIKSLIDDARDAALRFP